MKMKAVQTQFERWSVCMEDFNRADILVPADKIRKCARGATFFDELKLMPASITRRDD